MSKMDEQILVVDRDWLFDDEQLAFNGLGIQTDFVKLIMRKLKNTYEVKRGLAEDDTSMKQPIPYVVIKRDNEVFLYERLKAGGEKRLHNQLSIGVGGHMNNLDKIGDWRNNLLLNMLKELSEELYINLDEASVPEIIGIINDDRDDVGSVHLGILVIVEVPKGAEVSVRETDKLDGYWVRIKDLPKVPLFDRLEAWSKIAVDGLWRN